MICSRADPLKACQGSREPSSIPEPAASLQLVLALTNGYHQDSGKSLLALVYMTKSLQTTGRDLQSNPSMAPTDAVTTWGETVPSRNLSTRAPEKKELKELKTWVISVTDCIVFQNEETDVMEKAGDQF